MSSNVCANMEGEPCLRCCLAKEAVTHYLLCVCLLRCTEGQPEVEAGTLGKHRDTGLGSRLSLYVNPFLF